ncbi:MAG: phosphatidylglycerol lysyltransferase [Halocynthiibacter sp.]|jgi:phosphatidylglycerol lysyltransferase
MAQHDPFLAQTSAQLKSAANGAADGPDPQIAEDPTLRDGRRDLRKLALRQLVPVGIMCALLFWVWEYAATLDFAAIHASLGSVTGGQWALALVFSAASFWAVGRYDCVVHRQLSTGIKQKSARRAGILAIAIAQAVGLGAITGALIRWRMIPEMTLWQALRLSAAVSLSFLAGWAVVAGLGIMIFQPALPWSKTLVFIAIGIGIVMAALAVWPPRALARLPLPSLRAMATVIGLAAADTVLAGMALYVLLPPGLDIALPLLISSFIFALGAGLLGGTPGGVGPFEVTLLALMPHAPTEPLLAAALGFRVVYHIIPATIAIVFVLRGPRETALDTRASLTKTDRSPFLSPQLEAHLFAAPRAEVNLLRQGEFALLTAAQTTQNGIHAGQHLALAAPIGQSLVMLSDPMIRGGCPEAARIALREAAQARYLLPAIYKCGGRMAAVARRAGWAVLPVAREAWITPTEFTPEGASRRQLRRLLRKAEDAGLRIIEGGRRLPMAEMRAVADEWKAARGGERGFSMGIFDEDYVSCQRVFLAWHDETLVAFATFHETRNEMTLDLMRQSNAAAEGVMQLLIVEAIKSAAKYGCPRVSLAAVPWQGADKSPLIGRLRKRLQSKSGAEGLIRFKKAFGPNWETLYAAAPSRFGLAIAGLGILRRITAPPKRTSINPMQVRAGLRAASGAAAKVRQIARRQRSQ